MTMAIRIWKEAWATRAIALHFLGLLDAKEVAQLMLVDKTCRISIKREMKRFRYGSARLGMAMWCTQHMELEFQSYYQELETHTIPRSRVHDPRVPPRVASLWAERGKVPGGVVRLYPEMLPKRHERGFALRFVASADQKPMLTTVVRTHRRIYTVVTLQIVKSGRRGESHRDHEDRQSESSSPLVLRRLWYLKEFGEWRAMVPAAEKRRLDVHGALCRYDLVSYDGSIALELDVPSGADSMMDYYLVKKAAVFLPVEELLHPYVKTIRPLQPLPAPSSSSSSPQQCTAVVSFSTLSGDLIASYKLPCELTVEQQQQQSNTSDAAGGPLSQLASAAARPPRTGLEHFDIITIKAITQSDHLSVIVALPLDPGYIWVSLLSKADAASTSCPPPPPPRYYTMVMLHHGATRSGAKLQLDSQWVPGTLESFPTLQSRHRRCLKGFLHLSTQMESHLITEMKVVAQHLPQDRLQPYAATIESSTRPI